jgi:hypothetical protein
MGRSSKVPALIGAVTIVTVAVATMPRPAGVVVIEFDAAALDAVRGDPASVVTLGAACAPSVERARAVLGELSPAQERAVVCCALAHALAPYGESAALDPDEVRRSDRLNCGNYGVLLTDLLEASRLPDESYRVAFVGMEGGATGNHQVLFFVTPDGESLFLDPTVGVVARATFDEVLSGRPVDRDRILRMSPRGDLASFEPTVVEALTRGRVRPSDLLYYFDGSDAYRRQTLGTWATPAGAAWLARQTPD